MNHPKLCKGHGHGGGREGASSQALYRWLWGNLWLWPRDTNLPVVITSDVTRLPQSSIAGKSGRRKKKKEQPRTTQQNQFLPLLLDHRYPALNMLWFYLTWRYRQNFATSKIDLGPRTSSSFPSLLVSGCSSWPLAWVGLLFSLVW